jgi:hypothetical protein
MRTRRETRPAFGTAAERDAADLADLADLAVLADLADLELMFCTEKRIVSRVAEAASEPREHATMYALGVGNNASAERIKADGEFSMVQKKAKRKKADSLVYEYLAGLHVNELACYFPCFPRTYALFTEAGSLVHQAQAYAQAPSHATLGALVSAGCEANDRMYLRTQHMPVSYSMDAFVGRIVEAKGEEQVALMHALLTALWFVYFALSSVAGVFTHYDLHTQNVGVVEIPDGTVRVTGHYGACGTHGQKESADVSYTTRHMPVVWDFGRSFVDCRSLRRSLHSSDEIFEAVCARDRNDYSEIVHNDEFDVLGFKVKETPGPCAAVCGNESGYRTWPMPSVDAHYRERVFAQEDGRGRETYLPSHSADTMLVSGALEDKRLVAAVKAQHGAHAVYAAVDALMRAKRTSVHDTLRQLQHAVSSAEFQAYVDAGAHARHVRHVQVWYGLARPFSTEPLAPQRDDENGAFVPVESVAEPEYTLATKRFYDAAVFTDTAACPFTGGAEREGRIIGGLVRALRYTALERRGSADAAADFGAIERALQSVCERKASEIEAEHGLKSAAAVVLSVARTQSALSRALDMTYGTVTPTGYVERKMCVLARYDGDGDGDGDGGGGPAAAAALLFSSGGRDGVVDTVDIHMDEEGLVLRDLCAVCDSLGLVISASAACATRADHAAKKEKYARLGFQATRAIARQSRTHRTLVARFRRAPPLRPRSAQFV